MQTTQRFIQPASEVISSVPDCTLRTLRESDIPAMLHHLDDSSMWQFLAHGFPAGALSERAVEAYLFALHETARVQCYAVATPHDDRFVGCVTAHFGDSVHSRSVEYGGWVGRSHWRSGIARIATVAFTDWLFREHQVLRVFAAPYHANRAAIGTLQASGFTFEGRQRCSVFKDGQVMDQMLYAKLNPACAALPRAPDRPARDSNAVARRL